MGGGLARQLANQYPMLEEAYSQYCKSYDNDYKKLRGQAIYGVCSKKIIANIFSQKINFNTDYKAMKKGLTDIKVLAKNHNFTIAIPYKIGCGIANGDWNKVRKIIDKVFKDYDITIYKLKED